MRLSVVCAFELFDSVIESFHLLLAFLVFVLEPRHLVEHELPESLDVHRGPHLDLSDMDVVTLEPLRDVPVCALPYLFLPFLQRHEPTVPSVIRSNVSFASPANSISERLDR